MVDIKHRWLALKTQIALRRLTQSEVATQAGVDQATVSRILARCPRRNGKAFYRLCNYALMPSSRKKRFDPRDNGEMMEALRDVWDGTDDHAEAIAGLIRAAGYLSERPERR